MIIEVRGWSLNDQKETMRYHYLSILAEDDIGEIFRLSIVADNSLWPRLSLARKTALMLEELYQVPRHVIENPKTRLYHWKT